MKVRRAARGLCLWKDSKWGGAARARPEFRRMMSASDRRCLAAHGAGLSTRPSSGLSARIAPAAIRTDRGCGFRNSGTDPDAHHASCPPQARTGLAVRTQPFGWREINPGPVAGFARVSKETRPPAEPRWPPPPCATCRTLRQIPKGLPPAWSKRSRTIRQRECKNDDMRFGGCGRKWGGFCARGLRLLEPGSAIVHAIDGFRGMGNGAPPFSPLGEGAGEAGG